MLANHVSAVATSCCLETKRLPKATMALFPYPHVYFSALLRQTLNRELERVRLGIPDDGCDAGGRQNIDRDSVRAASRRAPARAYLYRQRVGEKRKEIHTAAVARCMLCAPCACHTPSWKPYFRPRQQSPTPPSNSDRWKTGSVSTMAAMHLMNSRVVALVRGVPKSFAKV